MRHAAINLQNSIVNSYICTATFAIQYRSAIAAIQYRSAIDAIQYWSAIAAIQYWRHGILSNTLLISNLSCTFFSTHNHFYACYHGWNLQGVARQECEKKQEFCRLPDWSKCLPHHQVTSQKQKGRQGHFLNTSTLLKKETVLDLFSKTILNTLHCTVYNDKCLG